MADILIHGIEMPPSCSDCPMCYDQMECTVRPIRFWHEELPMDFRNDRHPDCPLHELPEHGDLIDRNEAIKSIEWKWAGKAAFEALKQVPAVIQSNKEETK